MRVYELIEELSLYSPDIPVHIPGFEGFTPINSVRMANVIMVGQDDFGEDILDEGGGEPNAIVLEFDYEKEP